MAKSVSFRRPNRDYNKTIDWTYELNRELYDIYIKSEPDRIGFMQRLKDLWDKQHPEINTTSKNLNERAKRIIRNKLVFATDTIVAPTLFDSANIPKEPMSKDIHESDDHEELELEINDNLH